MKTIVIEWHFDGQTAFAHFPEPFPMDPQEWEAFASVFDELGFTPDQSGGDRRTAPSSAATRERLTAGLKALGYAVEERTANVEHR
ncbi:hypothetical protein G8E10_24905 [Rhizobiaceae bacterium CRRU44]|uniref:Uncharacterized protein n=1 Tax=Ferranicluibacter rubi TaxID=2715133 RepID=A0AA43ZJ94_9HYPH|nr:hypothetical protein [Ferranicluibacter rubi]NHT78943.1 hypothetical protein [Ferranicluibacter rubi]